MHIWNGMVKGFSKMYNFSFFGQIFFANIFTTVKPLIKNTSEEFIKCRLDNFWQRQNSVAVYTLMTYCRHCLSITKLIFLWRKTKNVQIFFDRLFAKHLQFFFRKTFLMSKAFQKAKFYQNLTCESGSKQRFSLLQEKAVIQAVFLRTQAVSIKALF